VYFWKNPAALALFAFRILILPLPAASAVPPQPDAQCAALLKLAPRLVPQALQTALADLRRLRAVGAPVRTDVLTVIDYTKPSASGGCGCSIWCIRVFCSKSWPRTARTAEKTRP